jgi:hypothetical protein
MCAQILLAPDTVPDTELLKAIQDRLRAMTTKALKKSSSIARWQSNPPHYSHSSDAQSPQTQTPAIHESSSTSKYSKGGRRRSAQTTTASTAYSTATMSATTRRRATTSAAAQQLASSNEASASNPNAPAAAAAAAAAVERQMLTRFPFAAWAACAASVGRKRLAFELCLLEPRLSLQVVQLLSMREWDRGMRLVNEAPGCDPKLQMYAALYCLALAKAGRIPHDLLALLFAKFACLKRCLTWILREQDPKLLGDLLLADGVGGGAFEHAMLLCEEATTQGGVDTGGGRLGGLAESAPVLKRAAATLSKSGSRFHASVVQDQSKLLEMQHAVSDSLQGRSLADTVLDCFRRGNEELADKFRLEFKMRPTLFFAIKLKGLVARHAWPEVRNMAASKDVAKVLAQTDFAEACLKVSM